ncbi:hypothetical protein [Marinobacter confluentis]|uniref:Uncharacterized protein n=1 Tax=Marinobacter confluentis TaxID=1697557 RepID=A0A4Z1BIS9_9GAMM|nr:hypothetical protein [Marinobacter confluentis]TGN39439.1 hypothetical protein E5Q11_12500 [Marinobacter confluentis]
MATTDQPFEQALLYLRAAGHDTGAETRTRLQCFILAQRDKNPGLKTAELLQNLPQWFDLPRSCPDHPWPPIARTSIGYPNE